MSTCKIDNCGKPVRALGLCGGHYERRRSKGAPTGPSHSEKFWSKTVAGYGGCIIWTGASGSHGYGTVRVAGKYHSAHRWAYGNKMGDIPRGLVIDHLCRVRLCVNPYHMEPVTHRENVLRGTGPTALNAAKTHCDRGHELSVIRKRGNSTQRTCGECTDAVRRKEFLDAMSRMREAS